MLKNNKMKKTTNSNPLKYFNDQSDDRKKSVIEGNKKLIKAQAGMSIKPTADSSKYYKKRMDEDYESAAMNMSSPKYRDQAFKRAKEHGDAYFRQSNKGKPGYDANGFPIKTKKK